MYLNVRRRLSAPFPQPALHTAKSNPRSAFNDLFKVGDGGKRPETNGKREPILSVWKNPSEIG
jgi:hypothetical protein